MVKKKSARQRHQKEALVGDTSEEELKVKYEGKICQHIPRGLNFARVKKAIKATNITICGGCSESNQTETEDSPEVWLCLQCGNRGCGRLSSDQHAIQHFKTIHSDCHALVLSSSSGVVWCYECDDEVNLQQSRNLRQCAEFLSKSKGNKSSVSVVNKSLSTSQPSSLQTVIKEQVTVDSKTKESKLVNKNKKETVASKPCVKGLRNLGNTCFFNAVMQNLNQTNLLFQVLERACSQDYVWEVPHLTMIDDAVVENTKSELLKIAIPRQFPLANSLLNVYKLLNASTSVKNEIVNPSPLFSEISKKCPQFKHFQEQDSHELLRQLLDSIRQDEVKRQKKAILRHFDIANIPVEEVDEESKKLVKAYSCFASHTLVEKIFGGLFISTVLCEECKTSSQVFEPFMDMSLPLFEEKQQENCNQSYLDGGQLKEFEPLRNRKSGVESEENEYVLTKAKKETGKPSKHQLRKLKDLAKKEKKKKAVKSRKLSETIEGNEELSTENEKPEEQTAADEGNNSDNESKQDDEENVQITEEETVNKETNNSVCAGMVSENDTPLVNGEVVNEKAKLNGFLPYEAEFICNSDEETNGHSAKSKSEMTETFEESKQLSSKLEEGVKIVDSNTVAYDSNFSKNTVKEKLHLDSSTISKSDLPVDEDSVKLIFKDSKNNVPLNECMSVDFVKANTSLQESQGGFVQNVEDNIPDKKNLVTLPEIAHEEQLDESLTHNFNNINISNQDTLESDERMQALGLQVKEVRIRRDSDRQGSILDSSLSPDEETNLASCESQDDSCENEQEENWSCNVSENQVKEWILKSLFTLKPRKHIPPNECSLDSCLTYFTKPELLTGSNKFRCEKCTEIKICKSGNKKDVAYSNASKQLLIFSPPAILTLHLKRFQQVGMSLRKVNRFVEFPSILDLAPYCSSACLILPHMTSVKDEVLYSLYGVVEHSGRMSSGHYTAFVKATTRTLNQNFMCHLPLAQCDLEQLLQKFSKIGAEKTSSETTYSGHDRRWYYISDAHVREVDEAQVMKCQAYLLFYERIK